VTTVYQQNGSDHYNLIAQSLKTYLGADTRFGGYFGLNGASFNPLRKQYNPEYFVQQVAGLAGFHDDYRMGIVQVDIYARGLNYIFGLADGLRRVAIVSVYRLAGAELHERIAKEVIHEMGHLLGLDHCADPLCVMYFSNTLDDTDKKSKSLCRLCRSKKYEE